MRRALRLPLAVGTALAVTEVAVRVLRPRGAGPDPGAVEARAYFSEAELLKARTFRRGQRAIMLASMAVDTAVLTALVRKPPTGHPALVAAGMTVGGRLTGLPLSAVSRQRSVRAGLDTQSWGGWAADLGKATAVSVPISAGAGWLLVAGMQRYGDRWWLPGAGGLVAAGVLSLIAGPTLIDPIFNTFEPAEPQLRDRIMRLAERGGVKVDRVLVMDASKRTTMSNAYVTGLGATKRVVFYDTLLTDFSEAEVDFVVAHELAHVRHKDVQRSLAFVAVIAPATVYAIARLAELLGAKPDASALPSTMLAASAITPALGAIGNELSRAYERRADRFAMALIPDPRTQIEFQKRISVKNLGDPDPPAWVKLLFGTHPTTLERIAMAEQELSTSSS